MFLLLRYIGSWGKGVWVGMACDGHVEEVHTVVVGMDAFLSRCQTGMFEAVGGENVLG